MANNKRFGPAPGAHVLLDKVQPGKDLAEFKKNNPHIFDHLSASDENAAYEELFKEVSPAPKAASPAPSGETAKS